MLNMKRMVCLAEAAARVTGGAEMRDHEKRGLMHELISKGKVNKKRGGLLRGFTPRIVLPPQISRSTAGHTSLLGHGVDFASKEGKTIQPIVVVNVTLQLKNSVWIIASYAEPGSRNVLQSCW